MGLKLGTEMGEYIVGGWSIGTVLDSAASRASLPGMFSSKTDTSMHALNVAVNVEWWSGDRLFRSYCNVENTVVGRHRQRPGSNPYNVQYSEPATVRKEKAERKTVAAAALATATAAKTAADTAVTTAEGVKAAADAATDTDAKAAAGAALIAAQTAAAKATTAEAAAQTFVDENAVENDALETKYASTF